MEKSAIHFYYFSARTILRISLNCLFFQSNNSQEGETYGFGLQFQQSRQSHFYQQEMQPGHNQGYGTANHDQVKMSKK